SFCEKWVKGMKLDIRFTFNRLSHRLQHRSVDLALEHSLTHFYLFPQYTDTDPNAEYTKIQQFYNRNIGNNEQQMLAINNIVNNTSQDMPFVIFGPPGTGKTSTIVEAIVQIYNRDRTSNILACTPSNRSCDLLVERMLVFGVKPKDVFRMYAASYNIAQIPAPIKNCSNAAGNFIFMPAKEQLQSNYRIIVCTLATSGRLVTANLKSGHFSYVFIDEIGQATEPEALIPLAGICEPDVADVHVVIAGDPKQLGPVLRSTTAIKFGLGSSNCNEQLRQHSHYDNNYIVKLLNNYRCHPSLLQVSNELFYDNELIPSADPVFVGQYLRWDKLPNPAMPLIFHGVRGKDERESSSPSFFNIQEIVQVKFYVDELMTSSLRVSCQDIGIITPYRKQVIVHKLKQALRGSRYKDITVASVEEYQGREKKVIIISTVRSTKHFMLYDAKFNVGFLKNPKRFNVAITRCQCLLIVIGDPHLLTADPCWRKLLMYCVTNNCYVGTPFKLNENEELSDETDILDTQLDASPIQNINDADGVVGIKENKDSNVDDTILNLNDMCQLFKEMQLEQLAS
ncbi:hypothetical protein HELRODRAFT_86659, partial [Helobdella robusta]|uniref:RNA helicase n=1 Tax=Helobdella robusta TaxID=6412 RepID=T1G6F0_HELRO